MRQEQSIGALIVCIVIGIVAAAVMLVPRFAEDESTAFEPDSLLVDSLQRQWDAAHPRKYKKYGKTFPKFQRHDTVQICMQPFDPNTADSLTLLRVGLKPWQAKAMLSYRAKGGRWRKPEDMLKLYGMTDSLYAALEPWIAIDTFALDSQRRANDSIRQSRLDSLYAGRKDSLKTYHEKRDTVLELNRADTFDLQYIRGIGSTSAKQIVVRRQKLGGFVHVTQLAEVPGFRPGVPLDSLYPHFTVDTTLIRFINVNHASLSQLGNHPYITYEQARQLLDLRHRRTIRSEQDLLKYGIFSQAELDNLRPYLRYDK